MTPREDEVFNLVARGLLNKQIAHRLGISEKTTKVHRARVMEKMQADSLAPPGSPGGKAGYILNAHLNR